MIKRADATKRQVSILAPVAILCLALGLGGTPPQAEKAAPEAMILRYKMPEGGVLRYRETGETREIQEAMGQSLETIASSKRTQTFRGKGRKGADFLIGVTVDEWAYTIFNPAGDFSPDLKEVTGKTFDMVLSPLGTEVDVSAGRALTYAVGGRTLNVASQFEFFFPDLPEKPVRVGDTWPTRFTIRDPGGESSRRTDIEILNTVEALEVIEGRDCLRIASTLAGVVAGTGKQQDLELRFEGTVKGTDVWYFAPREGLFVKSASDITTEMKITVSGAQGIVVPVTQKQKGEVRWLGNPSGARP